VEATAASFGVTAARLLITVLSARQDDADALQVMVAMVGVKRQGGDQGVGGVADLAECDQRVFPPEAGRFAGPRRDDSPC
jgi:hypothetical protein